MATRPTRFHRPIRKMIGLVCMGLLTLAAGCAEFKTWTEGLLETETPGVKEDRASERGPSLPRTSGELAVEYEPELRGAPDKDLAQLLESVSDTFGLRDTPPPSINLLRHRAESDLETMRKVLRSYGYFKGEAATRIDEDQTPVRVIFVVEPGPRFSYQNIEILDADGRDAPILPEPTDVGLVTGDPYKAEEVVQSQNRIMKHLEKKGRPFPELAERDIVADFDEDRVDITFRIDPGSEADFGETTIEGLEKVDEVYVRRRLAYDEGEPFDGGLLEQTRVKLMNTGLFAMVNLKPQPVENGQTPITISVNERPFRTVSAGVGYETDTGPQVRTRWEHRNLFGQGERFEATLRLNNVEQRLKGVYNQPDFFHYRQTFSLMGEAYYEDTDSYEGRSLEVHPAVQRQLTDHIRGGAGVWFRLADLTDKILERQETYGLLSLPVNLYFDNANDLLNPTRGWRVSFNTAPYTDTLGKSPNFLKTRLTAVHYQPIIKDDWLVLAGRGSYGFINGADRDELPRDELFYAGGGGSVRGFGYQMAGDLVGTNPRGGGSVAEVSFEVRFKVTETIGFATFIDGGRAYADSVPDLDDDLFWGTGLGARLYTALGPIRLDFAVPVNPREDIDAGYQIYVSIGQAF